MMTVAVVKSRVVKAGDIDMTGLVGLKAPGGPVGQT
jgi:hypothetical protein